MIFVYIVHIYGYIINIYTYKSFSYKKGAGVYETKFYWKKYRCNGGTKEYY